jgi:filamentous hemagglutinin
VNQSTVAKNLNTVIEPGVDVAGDVARIQAGKAARMNGNYIINGRAYGVHDGTLYPISGPGFHQLSRGAFQALGVLNKFGNTPQAHTILGRMKNVGPAEIEAALKAWSASR